MFIYFKLESNLLQGRVPEKARRQAYAAYADVEEEDNDKTEGGKATRELRAETSPPPQGPRSMPV